MITSSVPNYETPNARKWKEQQTDRNYHGSKSAIEIDILLENKMIVNVFASSDLKSSFFFELSSAKWKSCSDGQSLYWMLSNVTKTMKTTKNCLFLFEASFHSTTKTMRIWMVLLLCAISNIHIKRFPQELASHKLSLVHIILINFAHNSNLNLDNYLKHIKWSTYSHTL